MTYDEDDDSDGGYESDEDLDDEYADVNYDDEDNVTINCPYCAAEIYEDAEQCPHCGQYISDEDAPREGKPAWLIVVILLCIAMMLLGIIVEL
jgi:predicted nucleic acid-binding Zn ribbon protein